MTKTQLLVASALAAAVATAGLAGTATAAENEKCFGIAKAAKNDCQFASGSCAGSAPKDAMADTWIYVPAGTCDKIVGGSPTPKT